MQSDHIVADIVIIGAGVIGSAVAMSVAKKSSEKPGTALSIAVVDLDLEGTFSSSELNAGGVRATWGQPLNILASKFSIEYFERHAHAVGYRPCGYLWLYGQDNNQEKWKSAQIQAQQQRALGWQVDEWSIAELRNRLPFIDKTDDLSGVLFGKRDGLINSNLLKMHFRKEAEALGVRFYDRIKIEGAAYATPAKLGSKSSPTPAVLLRGRKFTQNISDHIKQTIDLSKSLPVSSELYQTIEISTDRVVNCAGPWAGQLARVLGYESPAKAVRRQVCLFDSREVDLSHCGMVIDPSGVYFHPEATYGLSGYCVPGEPEGKNFTYDGESFFQDYIWPALHERSTGFERLKHVTGWAGLYETSPDESAILGPVDSRFFDSTATKGVGHVFDCHSFSGHGVMHSYAAGVAMAELLLTGKFETLDFRPLSAARFLSGELLHEGAVI